MNVAIIGAGTIGLASALAAAAAGHSVTIYDLHGFKALEPAGEMSPRVWALGPKAIALLTRLGAWREDDRVCAYQSMQVIDSGSDAQVRFAESQLGVIVEADWVKCRLLQQVQGQPISCRTETVQQATEGGVLTLSDGSEAAFDLVVFAEGRAGQTAKASGFVQVDGGYHQAALVATLAASAPHQREAFQVFTEIGPLALLPLPDQAGAHRVSLVWSMPESEAASLQTLSHTALAERVTRASESVRGELDWISEPIWIPISQHALKRDAIGRLLAVGDTAHGILPLAGLGANLGLADVAALYDVLQDRQTDGARVARTVERMRRFDQQAVAFTMGLFSDAFLAKSPLARLGRSWALRTANQHGSLRRFVQELAS